jgi:hypothetical protein
MALKPSMLAAAFTVLVGMTVSASAAVSIVVDKSSQRMSVSVDGATRYSWPVSTGKAGYGTPNGTYSPTRLHRTWFSRKYYNSPMPYSIFFHGGYAIHGSYAIRQLGGPASHGCIRLHPSNAATLFSLVKSHGAGSTRITVTGSAPRARHKARRAKRSTSPRSARTYRSDYRRYYSRPRGYYSGYGGYYYR